MDNRRDRHAKQSHSFVYRGTLPLGVLLLLIAPMLFVFLSMAALLLAGVAAAALLLPLFWRRHPAVPRDGEAIELDRSQYTHLDPDRPQLPPR